MTPLALTPPAIEPVSLSEAKDFLRIIADDEDELLGTLITAARLMIEAASGRLLIEQGWRIVLDTWPQGGEIRLPLSPVRSLTAAFAGANAIAFIDPAGEVEIATAARVELIGARTFRLSQLVRGLGGSEASAARTLAPGARVVVLDGAAVPLTTSLDDIGRHIRYRVRPPNADVAASSMRELSATVGAAPLRPLAPVRIRARRLPSGIALNWIRRSRFGGDSWETTEVPLGEDIERYRVTIRASGAPVRIVEINAPAMFYEATQELAEFGSPQAMLDVELAQLSVVAGPGPSRRGLVVVR